MSVQVGMDVPAVPRVVAMIVLPGTPILELAVPTQVFGTDPPGLGGSWYELRMCSDPPGEAAVVPGISVGTSHGFEAIADADTVIVPAGDHDSAVDPPRDLIVALQDAHSRGARIAAIRSGTFLVAAAGLLDGRTATTHWAHAEELGRRHPEVQVHPSALYTGDGTIFTCAGGAATLDLCLELIRHDYGVTMANRVGHAMIAPPHRAGEQAQVVQTLWTDRDLAKLLDWVLARLDQPLTLADLCRAADMSPRTLARRFHSALGTTPVQWLVTQRIRLAQELLETTNEPIQRIAERTGLGTLPNFRRQFTRATGVPPQTFRRTFRGRLPGAVVVERDVPASR
jgi:transcriptional regulator GlxA family with amidase domain